MSCLLLYIAWCRLMYARIWLRWWAVRRGTWQWTAAWWKYRPTRSNPIRLMSSRSSSARQGAGHHLINRLYVVYLLHVFTCCYASNSNLIKWSYRWLVTRRFENKRSRSRGIAKFWLCHNQWTNGHTFFRFQTHIAVGSLDNRFHSYHTSREVRNMYLCTGVHKTSECAGSKHHVRVMSRQ